MRLQLLKCFIVICLLILITSMPTNGQDYKVIFKVDMSKAEVDDPATVGIRGSEAPLSWTETYPMKGPDKNGMYTASIPFENMGYGTRVQYKYYHDDNKWDNDKYGEWGNRTATLCCKKQKLPIDTWDHLDQFSFESRLLSASWGSFMNFIFVIGNAKKRGLTMKETAMENVNFWEWPIPENNTPEAFIIMDEQNQARTPFGYFEIIEESPEKVEYIINKDWEIQAYKWSEDGVVKGVSAAEVTSMIQFLYHYYVEQNGWAISFAEEEDHKMRIMITK